VQRLKIYKAGLLILTGIAFYLNGIARPFNPFIRTNRITNDSVSPISASQKLKLATASNCYDINWATWNNFTGFDATGNVTNADGTPVNVLMHANYSFSSTSSIYNYTKFNGYPSAILTQLFLKQNGRLG
jgi:hypothetical protein